MGREEVLKKAVKKVVRNGWNILRFIKGTSWEVREDSVGLQVVSVFECGSSGCIGTHRVNYNVEKIVFHHDFAKAFWKSSRAGVCSCRGVHSYKFHLQEMVLWEDPISYLEKFVQ